MLPGASIYALQEFGRMMNHLLLKYHEMANDTDHDTYFSWKLKYTISYAIAK